MKGHWLAMALLVGAGASGQVAAQEEASAYERDYNACVDRNGPINNSVVYECAGTVSDRARADINRYYARAQARILENDPAAAGELEKS